MSYPVAYRAAAAAYSGGIQSAVAAVAEALPYARMLPRMVPLPPWALALALAVQAVWSMLDYLRRRRGELVLDTYDYTAPVKPVERGGDLADLTPPGVPPFMATKGHWYVPPYGDFNWCSPNAPCWGDRSNQMWYQWIAAFSPFCSGVDCSTVGDVARTTYTRCPPPAPGDWGSIQYAMEQPGSLNLKWVGQMNRVQAGHSKASPMPNWITTIPIAAAPTFPDYGDDDEYAPIPFYPTAWDLPIKEPGELAPPMAGWPFAQRRNPPMPAWAEALPRVPAVHPGTGEVVGTKPITETSPGARVVTTIDTSIGTIRTTLADTFGFPPDAGTKEVKAKTLAALGTFKAAYGFVTELKDFAQALWKGLPRCAQGKYGKGGPTSLQMLADVYHFWDNIRPDDIKVMLKNVIKNEIEDRAYGKFGQFNSKVSKAAMTPLGTPFGFQVMNTAGGFGPKEHKKRGAPKIDFREVDHAVDFAVDTVWGFDSSDASPKTIAYGKIKKEQRCPPGFARRRPS